MMSAKFRIMLIQSIPRDTTKQTLPDLVQYLFRIMLIQSITGLPKVTMHYFWSAPTAT